MIYEVMMSDYEKIIFRNRSIKFVSQKPLYIETKDVYKLKKNYIPQTIYTPLSDLHILAKFYLLIFIIFATISVILAVIFDDKYFEFIGILLLLLVLLVGILVDYIIRNNTFKGLKNFNAILIESRIVKKSVYLNILPDINELDELREYFIKKCGIDIDDIQKTYTI